MVSIPLLNENFLAGICWILLLFSSKLNSVKGAETSISCDVGELGKEYVMSCSIPETVEIGINWYRASDQFNIVKCFNESKICLSRNTTLYYVTNQPQPDTIKISIIKLSEDDIKDKWICVDNTSFPSSIPTNAMCDQIKLENVTTPSSPPTTDNGETTTILPTLTTEAPGSCCIWDDCTHCSTVGGVVFIIDLVAGVVVFLVIIFVINKGLSIPIKIGIIGVFAVVSGILGGGLYAACIDCISFGGIVGIDIGCMVPVSVITIVVVKYSCNETKK